MNLKLESSVLSLVDGAENKIGEVDAFEVDLKVSSLEGDRENPKDIGDWLPMLSAWLKERYSLDLSCSQVFTLACAARKEGNTLRKKNEGEPS